MVKRANQERTGDSDMGVSRLQQSVENVTNWKHLIQFLFKYREADAQAMVSADIMQAFIDRRRRLNDGTGPPMSLLDIQDHRKKMQQQTIKVEIGLLQEEIAKREKALTESKDLKELLPMKKNGNGYRFDGINKSDLKEACTRLGLDPEETVDQRKVRLENHRQENYAHLMKMDQTVEISDEVGMNGELPLKRDGKPAFYKMNREGMERACKWRGLDTDGSMEILKERLLEFLKKEKLIKKKSGSSSSSSS